MPADRDLLEALKSMGPGNDKIEAFRQFEEFFTPGSFDVRSCKAVISSLTAGSNDYATPRAVMPAYFKKLEDVDEAENDALLELCQLAQNNMAQDRGRYQEAFVAVIDLLAVLYQADGDFLQAGKAMRSVDTEEQNFQSVMTIEKRCDWRIRTAELFLEAGDTTPATSQIQKARRLIREVPVSHEKRPELHIRYKTCYARILDSDRKFLQAAVNYMELSQIDSPLVTEGDLLASLDNSMTCAILGKAGPARARVLAMLYRDSRARTLRNYRVMEKMHLNRIVSVKDQDAFNETLDDHHRADLGNGLTVFKKAMFEHNMLAASQLYKNIRLEELDKLLGTGGVELAENLAREMIEEGRMKATIDQIDSTVEFSTAEGLLLDWDNRIQYLCMAMNDVCDEIDNVHPNKYELP